MVAQLRKFVRPDEAATILARTVDPQHPHIAGGRAAAGVGENLVQDPVATFTG
jgi:hypothetical protein